MEQALLMRPTYLNVWDALLRMDHYTTLILGCFLMTTILQTTFFFVKQYQLVKYARMLRELQESRDFHRRRKRQALLLIKQRRKVS